MSTRFVFLFAFISFLNPIASMAGETADHLIDCKKFIAARTSKVEEATHSQVAQPRTLSFGASKEVRQAK
jgi:hypothetical protein